MPSDLLDKLRILNVHRKALYHYGHADSESGLCQLTDDLIRDNGAPKLCEEFQEHSGYAGSNKDIYRFAMNRVLRENALSALTTALMLRSWLAATELTPD